MKNVSEPDSIFRKKGFFIALYSCLGGVAVLAVVVTLFTGSPEPYEEEPAAYAGADQVTPYQMQADEEAWFRPRPTPPPTPTPPPPRTEPAPQPEVVTPPEPPPAPPAPPPPPSVETFEPFTQYDRFVWPVYGEVIMPFSVTALIFDPTMDRFSTNDNIRIAALEGDPVRAGADGKVIDIGTDFWRGNYVTIDHGNGWIATIGQLMENVLVSEGEVVRAGQVIGGIGQPAISSSLNGTHVHLHITHNEIPVNPYDFLQAVYD